MALPLYIPAIAVITAATSIELKTGSEIEAFLIDNRSPYSVYVSYNGMRDSFEEVWPGDVQRFVVKMRGIKSVWIYAGTATTAGQVRGEYSPYPMYSG